MATRAAQARTYCRFNDAARFPEQVMLGQAMTRSIALIASVTLMLTTGCPEPSRAHTTAKCTKAYEQCTLAEGLLGVCDPIECSDGQSPPCFVCRSQH
jgi:hypothetical protein